MSQDHPIARILVVECQRGLGAALASLLSGAGFAVAVEAPDAALMALQKHAPDLIFVDLPAPDAASLTLCRKLRERTEAPIIMQAPESGPRDRVRGLDAGATDCLSKPTDADELLARVRAHLRARMPQTPARYVLGDLLLDEATREVRRGNRPISLTPKQYNLLRYLLRHPRQILTRQQLMEEVWGPGFDGDENNLEVYIRYLRSKLELPGEAKLIYTVRGIGYQIKDAEPLGGRVG